jgi:hypothetical protein
MKRKFYFQIALFIVLLNYVIATNVVAVDYNLELAGDANLIWTVDEFDEDRYDEIFEGYSVEDRPEADFDKDDQKQVKVTNIDTREKKWVISIDEWDYTDDTSDFSDEPDQEKYKTVYKDPEDQADDILVLEDITSMWIVPSPAISYIEDFRDEFDIPNIDVSVEDDKLIAKASIEPIPAAYEIEITYGNDGLAEKIEYIDDDGDTFIKISLLKETIPGYNLLLILLLICGLTGIIFWIKRLKINIKQ